MIRAQYKDKAYFDDHIEFKQELIDKKVQEFSDNMNTVSATRKMMYAIRLFSEYLGLLKLKYSRGDDIASMKSNVESVLKCRQLQKTFADQLPPEEQEDRMQYERITIGRLDSSYRWFAFALAVGMDSTYIKEALGLINLKGKDFVFDSIAVKLGDTREVTEKQWSKKDYGKLAGLIKAQPEERSKIMNKYLDRWYNVYGEKDFHINTDDGYWGYWCFEAALVTRLWNMDDSGWINHPYYPKDLVHRGL